MDCAPPPLEFPYRQFSQFLLFNLATELKQIRLNLSTQEVE